MENLRETSNSAQTFEEYLSAHFAPLCNNILLEYEDNSTYTKEEVYQRYIDQL